jgi:opacity protein-like surface antigen
MDMFRKLFLSFICFLPAITLADNNASLTDKNAYSIGMDLGVAIPTQAGNSVTFPLGYSTFSYSPNNNNGHTYITGISFSKMFALAPLYAIQVGASYHYISNMGVKGNLMQGISPPYYQANYSYVINSSQYLIEAKLRRQFHTNYFPYFYFGLGLAANSAFDYTTNVPPYLAVTPSYSNKTTHAFTYSIGIGIDYAIMSKLTLGLGYRFIDLGETGLGSGRIRNTSINAMLTQSNFYLNSLVAQLNYFI